MRTTKERIKVEVCGTLLRHCQACDYEIPKVCYSFLNEKGKPRLFCKECFNERYVKKGWRDSEWLKKLTKKK